MANSYWKDLRQIFAGCSGKNSDSFAVTRTVKNTLPLRQCPGCGLYSRNDPTECRQCTDVEFLLRTPYVVRDVNEDFTSDLADARDTLNRFSAARHQIYFQKNMSPVDDGNSPSGPSKAIDRSSRLIYDHEKIFASEESSSADSSETANAGHFRTASTSLSDALYLVSSATSRRDILRKIFLNEDARRPEGVYLLKLCVDGVWTPVIVDDSVPVDSHLPSHVAEGEMWMPLIVKAIAKLYGSYDVAANEDGVAGGDVCHLMEMLTGSGTESTRLAEYSSPDKRGDLWTRFNDYRENRFIMAATSGSVADETEHDGDCKRLRSSRNYRIGNVSEDQSGRKSISLQSIDEKGLLKFDITLDEFLKYFIALHVCRVRPDWTEVRIEGRLPVVCPLDEDPEVPIRRLTLTEKTSLDVTIYQSSHKLPCDLCIVIFTERSGHDIETRVNYDRVVCQSSRSLESSVSLECQLNPGQYLIACLSINSFIGNFQADVKFVMAVRSPQPLVLPMRKLRYTRCAITDAFIRLIQVKGAPSFPAILSPGVSAFTYTNCNWRGFLLLVENTSRDKFAVANCFAPSKDTVQASRSSMPTKDYIPPACRRIVAVLTEKEWNRSSAFSSIGVFLNGNILAKKEPSEDESTPKFDIRVKGLHVPRPIWLT